MYAAAIMTVVGFTPLVSVAASSAIARALGCRLDEGGVHPCPAFGTDFGEPLYRAVMMMRLFFATASMALLALALWAVLLTRLLPGAYKARKGQ
jgi:hypothetical protein